MSTEAEKQTDVGLVVEINDGPEYHPNFKRIVAIIGWDSMPGIVVCVDTKTGETVRVCRQKIESAKAEAFGTAVERNARTERQPPGCAHDGTKKI